MSVLNVITERTFWELKQILQIEMSQNEPHSQKQMANYESVKLQQETVQAVDLYTHLPYHSKQGSTCIFKL